MILSENSSIFAASIKRLLMISTLLFVIMFAVMSAFLMGLTQNLTQPLRQLTDKLIRLEPGENIPALPEASTMKSSFSPMRSRDIFLKFMTRTSVLQKNGTEH